MMYVGGNNLTWTRDGIKEVKEIREGHEILCIDENGFCRWYKISSPVSIARSKKLLHIILDKAEVLVTPSCKLCQKDKVVYAKELNIGDELEVFSNPDFISSTMSHVSKRNRKIIHFNGYGPFVISLEKSYLLGVLSQKTYVPSLWSNGIAVLKVFSGTENQVIDYLQKTVNDFELTAIRQGYLWTYIEFRSNIVRLIKYLPPIDSLYHMMLKNDANAWLNFICGVIKTRGVSLEGVVRIMTRIEETLLRKLIFNLLFLHSVECSTSFSKVKNEDVCFIDVPQSEFSYIENGKKAPKKLRPWSKIKQIFWEKSIAHNIPIETEEHWSPVIDLVLLA